MNHFLTFLFCIGSLISFGQITQGTINYSGRVTHMYNAEDDRFEIPYERQNTDGVLANIYFDSTNIELDLMATMVYTLNVTHQKKKNWLLYLERDMSDRTVETTTYEDLAVFSFDSLEFFYDSTRVIAGYSCNLARYEFAGIEYDIWFCKDLELGSNLLPVPDEIPGACLEFTLQLDIADVKFTAFSIDLEAPNENRFEMIIPSGYELETKTLFPVERPVVYKFKGKDVDRELPPPPPVFEEK